jgi:hypothetical protein
VAHACNPSYLGGKDWECNVLSSKPWYIKKETGSELGFLLQIMENWKKHISKL